MSLGRKFRTSIQARPQLGLSFFALIALSSCGGDSSTPAAPALPTNVAPSFTSGASVTVVENVVGSIYQAAANDANGDNLTYSLVGGADANRFAISAAGQLSFVASPNFDLPTDSDRNNEYEVTIGVTDGKVVSPLSLKVTVTNSKEGIAVRRIASGFINPVSIAPVSATAILVAEKAGAVYLLNPATGAKTLLVEIANVGGVGVTALAAAPTFAANGTFFAMYQTQTGFLIVTRYLRNPAGPTVPANSGPVVGVFAPDYAGGGWLGFDSKGDLLVATGDAGGNGDPTGSAQNDGSRLGKLLRITPNPDPFAGASPSFFFTSIIAKGLHWPNGGSFLGDSLVIADRGASLAEELNLVSLGSTIPNLGWPFKEGTGVVKASPPAGLLDPILQYFRSGGLRTGEMIVGGAKGPVAVASLASHYVFADGKGAIFSVPLASFEVGKTLSSEMIERRDTDFLPDQGKIDGPVAVTAGPDGALYILDGDGEIFRVDPS